MLHKPRSRLAFVLPGSTGYCPSMCRRSEALVSVIIPAFNAATTIRETLRSVCAQTHRWLEIIVVDDGSTDATVDIVTKLASDDPRIFLIEQRNGGVAAARNSGAAAASGTFLAPVDADDLWHPLKIEKQLDAFTAAGQGCGLVYTWSALIDGSGRVTHRRRGSLVCGEVLRALSMRNFVGNGSSAFIPTSVFRQTHGYDPSLHARGGQGCEDWKLYLEIAAQWHFTVVPEHLTGYRVVPGNMSSNALRMLRSRDLVSADLLPHHPELASALRRGRNRLSRFLLNRALSERRWRDAAGILGSMARFDGLHLTVALASVAAGAFRRTAERASSSREAFLQHVGDEDGVTAESQPSVMM